MQAVKEPMEEVEKGKDGGEKKDEAEEEEAKAEVELSDEGLAFQKQVEALRAIEDSFKKCVGVKDRRKWLAQ